MPTIKVRQIFSHHALARLEYDEPVAAHDAETGIHLHYRFEHHCGGRLHLSGGQLGHCRLNVGCDQADLNIVSTILLAGIRAQIV